MDSSRSPSGTLPGVEFTRTQRRRGLVLLGTFVVVRAGLTRVWTRNFGGTYSIEPAFLAFLGGIFLLLSVGLVYLGFTRWVGVDLRAWWLGRRLRGDPVWGVVGVVAILVVTVVGVLGLSAVGGLDPAPGPGGAPATAPTPGAEGGSGPVVTGPGTVRLILVTMYVIICHVESAVTSAISIDGWRIV